jgi:hypothetical protein
LDGIIDITIGDDMPFTVHASEIIFLSAGTQFSLDFKIKYCRFWSYASGDGLEALIHEAGIVLVASGLCDQAAEFDEAKVKSSAQALRIKFS